MDGGTAAQPVQKSKRPGRSTVRAAEEQVDTAQAQDVDGPRDEQPSAPAPSRGPVSVGRSLEILTSPDTCMDMLVDKLKLLNYEIDFCRKRKPNRKPLTRQYFAVAMASSSEQFFYFTSLTTWLLSLAGVEVPLPKEFDDPNVTCSNLLNAVRKLGFAPPSYHPSKLTQGCGKEVCGVLDGLVDYVLEKRNFQYRRPAYQPDNYGDDGGEEDVDDGLGMDGGDELVSALPPPDDEEEEEDAFGDAPMLTRGAADVATPSSSGRQKGRDDVALADKALLVSKVDPVAWRVELERVAPRLRITVAADSQDWRSHLDEAHQHQETITKAWPDSKTSLEKLRSDLNASLEKLMTREKFLNEQFEHLMQQYRGARNALTSIQDSYSKRTEGVSDRHAELQRINEQLDEIKSNMDEKGDKITDATPVVRIKTAIKKLNEELHDMEVRIGVVNHTLLQLSLKNKRELHEAAQEEDDED